MRTVLFTGAGASCAIGYALTRDLLPRILREIESEELFEDINGAERDADDREELGDYLNRLLPGLSTTSEELMPLVTDVFSMVEYSIAAEESLTVGSTETLRRMSSLLKQAIADVFLGDFLTPWDTTDPRQKEQRALLKKLVAWVTSRKSELGIVTTNYDIGLEFELYSAMGGGLGDKLDLGFDWRDPRTGREWVRPAKPELRVYKLHGSLDQLHCPLCGYVYFNRDGAVIAQGFRVEPSEYNTCHCHDDARLQPHIVAPSFVRSVRDTNLLSVWRSALQWMRTADRWVIVGYSLPPEDLAIRSLLMRAHTAAAKKPEIVVVMLTRAEEARYRILFPDCDYRVGGLEQFLGQEA